LQWLDRLLNNLVEGFMVRITNEVTHPPGGVADLNFQLAQLAGLGPYVTS
jgi:hypothetical protein